MKSNQTIKQNDNKEAKRLPTPSAEDEILFNCQVDGANCQVGKQKPSCLPTDRLDDIFYAEQGVSEQLAQQPTAQTYDKSNEYQYYQDYDLTLHQEQTHVKAEPTLIPPLWQDKANKGKVLTNNKTDDNCDEIDYKKEDELHGGHRNRLRNRYQKEGLQFFAPHEVLELLLYRSIPYKDVNELSHLMLQKFGNLKNVFAATPQQLCEFEGIDKSAAYDICLTSAVYRYLNGDNTPLQKLTTIADVFDYSYYLIGNSRHEELYIVCLDINGYVTGKRLFEDKVRTNLFINVQKVVETAVYFSAKQVFVLHSHPFGEHTPSTADREFTRALFKTLYPLGIGLIDHLIVGHKGKYSFYLNGEITALHEAVKR